MPCCVESLLRLPPPRSVARRVHYPGVDGVPGEATNRGGQHVDAAQRAPQHAAASLGAHSVGELGEDRGFSPNTVASLKAQVGVGPRHAVVTVDAASPVSTHGGAPGRLGAATNELSNIAELK